MLVVDGYSLIVPPDWMLVDLQQDIPEQVDDWTRARLLGMGGELRKALRVPLRDSMRELLVGLKERDTSAVLLPATPLERTIMNPIMVFRRLEVPEGSDPLDQVVATAAADASAELMESDAFVGLRSHQDLAVTEEAQEGADRQLPAGLQERIATNLSVVKEAKDVLGAKYLRHVRYLVGRPDVTDRWLDIAASIGFYDHPDSRKLADRMLELFDTVVGTLTWLN